MTREEAINEIKSWAIPSKKGREVLETLIPELCESEDERIRKWIKKEIENKYVVEGIVNNKLADEAFGWLEKQKHLYETTKDRFYREGFEEGQLYEKQKEKKPMSILTKDDSTFTAYCKGQNDVIENPEAYGLCKPEEWSEEDKQKLNRIYEILGYAADDKGFLTSKRIIGDKEAIELQDFLKSLSERFNLQPKQEWSKEDETAFDDLMWCIKQAAKSAKDENDMGNIWFAENWVKKRIKSLRPKKNISYGELPLVSIDYVEELDTDFEKQVGAVIASAMNREHQFTSKYIKWTAQRLIECAKDKQNSEEEHVSDNKEWSEEDEKMLDKVCCLISPGTILNASDADYCLELKQWIVSLQERIFKLSRTQPKQEWSKEDEYKLNFLTGMLEGLDQKEFDTRYMKELSSWFKSLPERFSLQPKNEWSEEDENAITTAIRACRYMTENFENSTKQYEDAIKRLESLRPPKDCSSCAKHLEGYISGRSDAENKLLEQFGALITPEDELHIKPRWKPSEEQLNYVNWAYSIAVAENDTKAIEVLGELHDTLLNLI